MELIFGIVKYNFFILEMEVGGWIKFMGKQNGGGIFVVRLIGWVI